jgi:hypothetical protein
MVVTVEKAATVEAITVVGPVVEVEGVLAEALVAVVNDPPRTSSASYVAKKDTPCIGAGRDLIVTIMVKRSRQTRLRLHLMELILPSMLTQQRHIMLLGNWTSCM